MKKKITYNEFSRLLNQPNIIDNNIIQGDTEFLGKGFTNDVLIKDCEFEKVLSFKNCRFFKSLTFDNCEFKKGICFSDFEVIGNLILKSCKLNLEAIFKDCIFSSFLSEDTHFDEVLFCGYLNNNGIKNLDIIFDKSYAEKISLNDLECLKNIRLNDILTKELEIYRSVIHKDISFGYFDTNLNKYFFSQNVYFESSKFLSRVDLYNGKIEETLYIHKIAFEEQVVVNRKFDADTLRLTEVSSKYSFSIDFQDNFDRLDLCDCSFNSSFTIHCFEKLKKYDHHISINFSGIIQGNYIIQDIPTLSIDMSCVNYGSIIFTNITTKFIEFVEFYNIGRQSKFILNGIKYNNNFNALIIYDSILGNTEFINIDFRKFNEVMLVKSDVSNMLLTNSLFPRKIQIKTITPRLGFEVPIEDKINDNLYFRDSYRQLKLAMEKMGNRYYALLYKSKEMYYHRKELNWGWDKILLYINYLSNNNGISWIRGIFFTLTCALIAFLCLNFQMKEPLFYWTTDASLEDTFEAIRFNAEYFISYLSTYPILKLDGLKENWVVDLIVLLSRIFVSVGIYQIITAFRKYGK